MRSCIVRGHYVRPVADRRRLQSVSFNYCEWYRCYGPLGMASHICTVTLLY